jgi:hypothetical protein
MYFQPFFIPGLMEWSSGFERLSKWLVGGDSVWFGERANP